MEQIVCKKCGQANDNSSKYCIKCGEVVKADKLTDEEYKFLYESHSGIATWFSAFAWLFGIAIFLFICMLLWVPALGGIGIVSCLIMCLICAALSEHFSKLNAIENTLRRIEKKL